MYSNLKILVAVIMVLLFSAGFCLAKAPSGNKRKGKYIYRNIYKECAKKGEVKSKTPPVSPSDKTMAQWKRIFDRKKFEIFRCTNEWSKLSPGQINDIYSYLYSHAADSPTPAKCK